MCVFVQIFGWHSKAHWRFDVRRLYWKNGRRFCLLATTPNFAQKQQVFKAFVFASEYTLVAFPKFFIARQ
jgi:hypothetical protein